MTIDAKCLVCRSPDRRRLIELGWNGGMSAEGIARVLEQKGLSAPAIIRHLKDHVDGDGNVRAIVVEPELPARERVLELQRLQLNEIERRIALAKAKAALMNAEHEGDADWHEVDYSDFYDILDKNAQAAITSILKTQGLTDKRESKTNELKVGLFAAMAKSGLAPKALVGDKPKQLPEPDEPWEDGIDDAMANEPPL